jgi:hypothetical protein
MSAALQNGVAKASPTISAPPNPTFATHIALEPSQLRRDARFLHQANNF